MRSQRAGVGKLVFEFLILTAVRWGEVRGAVWAEIDTANRVWTVPAALMKMKRDHRVPLCRRALEILDAAWVLADGGNPVVFPNERGKRLDDKRLRRLLWKHGIAAMVHGFRSSFRDWAAEKNDLPRKVIEAALAHVVRSKVEVAYARSDLFERRPRLMDA